MNTIALAWSLVAVTGLLLSVYLATEATRDLRAVRRARVSNGRRVLARMWLLREVLRGSMHAAYLGVGLALLGRELSPAGAVMATVLVMGNAVAIGNSLLDVRTRYLLRQTRDAEPPIDGRAS